MTTACPAVRAVYRTGVLQLIEPLTLAERAEVWVRVEPLLRPQHPGQKQAGVYPDNPQPAATLRALMGVSALGGDALADSEAL